LELTDRPPGPGAIRLAVGACGVCRTDLQVVEVELPDPQPPVIPGHDTGHVTGHVTDHDASHENVGRSILWVAVAMPGTWASVGLPGLGPRRRPARFAWPVRRTTTIGIFLRATRETGDLRREGSPMRATPSCSARQAATRRRHLCCALD
jgi:hypothetical protein